MAIHSLWLDGTWIDPEQFAVLAKSSKGFNAKVLRFLSDYGAGRKEFTFSTSGTTAPSKKIVLLRDAIEASALRTGNFLNLEKGDKALLCISPDFTGGVMMMARAVELGLNLYAVPPVSNPLTALPKHARLNFASFVPYQIKTMLASEARDKFEAIEKVIIGGAPIDSDLHARILNCKNQIYHSFGMTETYSHIALRKMSQGETTRDYRPLAGIKVEVDGRGCLVVEDGSFGRVVTNDLVERTDRGFIWLGRIDNVINSGGHKISPESIEHQIKPVLAACALDHNYFLGATPSSDFGEVLNLVIEADPALVKSKINQLKKEMSKVLRNYEVPKDIHAVARFKYTPNGKILRKATLRLISNPL